MNQTKIKTSAVSSAFTISLLTTHQVDASFQKEWELFGIPGGINFFLIFHQFAIMILLISLFKISSGRKISAFWRFIVPITGILTVSIHALMFAFGHSEFTQPMSILILALILFSSLCELYLEYR